MYTHSQAVCVHNLTAIDVNLKRVLSCACSKLPKHRQAHTFGSELTLEQGGRWGNTPDKLTSRNIL